MPLSLSTPTTPYYGGGQVTNPANVIYGNVSPPSNNAATGGGIIYINYVTGAVYISYNASSWVQVTAGGAGFVSTLGGNTGSASPSAGNINIIGSGSLSVAGSGSSLTISTSSPGGAPLE